MSVSGASDVSPRDVKPRYVMAWLRCALFCLYRYAARSAPGVVQSPLSTTWGRNHIGSMISGYYLTYALTALAAGLLLDRYLRCNIACRSGGCIV
jgi:MFS family permease